MKKNILKILVVTVVSVFALVGCGNQTPSNLATEPAEVVENKESVAVVNSREPEVQDVSETEKIVLFYRDGLQIFGKLYLPEGDGPYPLAILSYGMGGTYTQLQSLAQQFAKEDIAALTFDFTGSLNGKSEGDFKNQSAITQAADIEAILDSLDILPNIDKNNVFLWGHSLGGWVSTYVATKRPDEIRGLVALEPSYQMKDFMLQEYPNPDEAPDVITSPYYCGKVFLTDLVSVDIYEDMPKFKNNVLIIRGTVNAIGAESGEYLDRAVELFPSATQVPVEGADHSFGGEYRKIMTDMTIEFIKENTI